MRTGRPAERSHRWGNRQPGDGTHDRRLQHRTVVAVLLAIAPTQALAEEPSLDTSADAHAAGQDGTEQPVAGETATGALTIDPLGFLMFGPTIGAELALGDPSVMLYGRWLSAGFLAGQMFPNEEEEFAFSYGVGLRGRYYLAGNLEGLFAGLGIEYLRSRIENDSALIATNAHFLVPQLEAGYRLGLGAFFIGGSGAFGYALEVDSSVENLPGGTEADLHEVEDVSTVYGTVSAEIGVRF